jgi:hypothetical protein
MEITAQSTASGSVATGFSTGSPDGPPSYGLGTEAEVSVPRSLPGLVSATSKKMT